MKPLQLSHLVWGVVTGPLFLPGLLIAQRGLSHVRMVRLSYVNGTVAVQRPRSTDWEGR